MHVVGDLRDGTMTPGLVMRTRALAATAALLLVWSRVGIGQPSTADLDSIARHVIEREHVVGASVLVARGDRILLHGGYGYADLGLEAPTKDETVYHIVGPMMPFTGVALMQLVERGKVSLTDDVSKFVPEF